MREKQHVRLENNQKVRTESLRYVFVDPDGAVANAEMIWKQVTKERTLSVEFFTRDGTRRVLGPDETELLKRRGWNSETLKAHINGEQTWPLN